MILLDMEFPSCCDECSFYDDNWDYPTCIVNGKSSGYNFKVREKRMPFCPLKNKSNYDKEIIDYYEMSREF